MLISRVRMVLFAITQFLAISVPVVSGTGDPAVVGQWSTVHAWPLQAIHMVMLENSKVLCIDEGPVVYLWTPPVLGSDPNATGTFAAMPLPTIPGTFIPIDVFCSGHTQLADGRVVFVGGGQGYDSSHAYTVVFNSDSPPSSPWTIADTMPGGQALGKRWYPTCTTLGDGTVLVTGGDEPASIPHTADTPLIFDPSKSTGQQYDSLSGGIQHLPYYPQVFQLSNQLAFYAGTANGFGADPPCQKFNPVLETWTTVAANPTLQGAAVMHRPDQVLMVGGMTAAGAVTNQVYLIEPNGRTPAWTSRASMAYARLNFNLVLLPDGKALAVGGGGVGPNFVPVLAAEMYNPTADTWTTMDYLTLPRAGHSAAVLLPDGRVAVGGDINHAGLTAQIYSPPYLFQGPRPTISSVPGTIRYAQSFVIDSPNTQQVTQVSLVRLGATTHGFDQNQRFVPLEFVILGAGTGGPFSVLAAAPAHAYLAPPGYYLLFILVNGVPSEAAMVRLTS